MWDLPGPGLEPVSHALAGGFPTTVQPGSPHPGFSEHISNCSIFGLKCGTHNRMPFLRWVCPGRMRQEGRILFLFFTIKQLHLWQDVKSDISWYKRHGILKPDHHTQNLQRKWLRICSLTFGLWNHIKEIKRGQSMEKREGLWRFLCHVNSLHHNSYSQWGVLESLPSPHQA